ncbi:tripartite tricarboxylate transporter TctB family protein [Desulfosporosinus sp. SB140]|uniref:tripartite tricarboxylate transporter TctB family protein n=1 Tax=Desulfosporosinus paludis TaxID=3115649 RepID=UPI00388FAB43
MNQRLTGNLIEIIVTILLGVSILLLLPYQIQNPSDGSNVVVSPQLFPRMFAIVLILAGLFQLISYFKVKERNDEDDEKEVELTALLVGILAIFIYALLMPILGFIIATILDIVIFIYLIGRPKLYFALPVAVIATIIIWAVFSQVLNVPLPIGLLKI